MATIMMVPDGAIGSAFFSGSNYMFSTLGKEDVNTKRKRHDKPVEDLQVAQVSGARNGPSGLII